MRTDGVQLESGGLIRWLWRCRARCVDWCVGLLVRSRHPCLIVGLSCRAVGAVVARALSGGMKGSASVSSLSGTRAPQSPFPKPVTTLSVSQSLGGTVVADASLSLSLSGSASLPSLSASAKPRRTSLNALRAEDDLSDEEEGVEVGVTTLVLLVTPCIAVARVHWCTGMPCVDGK